MPDKQRTSSRPTRPKVPPGLGAMHMDEGLPEYPLAVLVEACWKLFQRFAESKELQEADIPEATMVRTLLAEHPEAMRVIFEAGVTIGTGEFIHVISTAQQLRHIQGATENIPVSKRSRA
jgi:hypothetical protein